MPSVASARSCFYTISLYSLAMQGGKLHARAHIPMLREQNVRTGFFEAEQFLSVRAHLPAALQPVVTFV
jgi:hypothetical protein